MKKTALLSRREASWLMSVASVYMLAGSCCPAAVTDSAKSAPPVLTHAPGPVAPIPITPKPADLVLLNGKVYSLNWGEPDLEGNPAQDAPHDRSGWKPDAEAVAIRGGQIAFVGDREGAQRFVGTGTRTIDLQGHVVLPGLIDSHAHVAAYGLTLRKVNLVGVETEAQAIAMIEERAKTVPQGQWILAWGFDEGAWANKMPDNKLLSKRVPHHPVHVTGLHGFASWNNKLAMKQARITAKTKAPVGGEIVLDQRNRPTGVLLNNATDLFDKVIPDPTPAERVEATLVGLQDLAQKGFVTIHEAGASRAALTSFQTLAEQGRLPIRVYAMLRVTDVDLMHEWIAKGPQQDREAMLLIRSVKAYYDASLGARGARLLADYSDKPGHRGVSGDNYGFDEALATKAMSAGFQIGVHAIGDAGNRETLDFITRVYETAPQAKDNRNRIEHAQIVHPDDQRRFAPLEVIAAMQPPHCVEDMAWAEERLGPDRVKYGYAWRSLRRLGARLALSSDLAGSDPDIFYGLHAAITRRNKQQEPAGGWFPEEALSPEEAVRGYTSWNAYAGFVDDRTGTLATGKWADITVMDIDPFQVGDKEPGKLLDGNIVMTIVNGRIVHDARTDN
ncbi:MAG: amidohydrolase [Myxococcota bacterium]|nr:amidohydrolase [Myxococcota bacterium]